MAALNIKQYTSGHSVDLSVCKLDSFPVAQLKKAPLITTIDVSQNQITALPVHHVI